MKVTATLVFVALAGGVLAAKKEKSISIKCGMKIYNCGVPPKSAACSIPGAKKATISESTSSALCRAYRTAKRTNSTFTTTKICPDGATVSHYTENVVGAGLLCSQSLCKKCTGAKCGGDPHFMTYDGTAYSYHGQCDLVMAKSQDIDGTGLSLDVHARTTIKADWSYVSNAAVKIGDDVLEITTNANITHYFNGDPNVDFPILMADKYIVRTQRVEAFPGQFRIDYMVDLKERDDGARERGDFIHIKYFKEMLTVDVEAHLPDSMGMLGVTGEEGMIKRDLKTQIAKDNTAQMGLEWQVRENEVKLFNDMNRAPQYPAQCYLPKVNSRRLRAVSTDIAALANTACAGVEPSMKNFCINDVVLTGDVQAAYMYNL